MNGLELVVADRHADEVWNLHILIMPELLQITHQIGHAILMWRYEDGIGQARPADPVLTDTKLTRPLILPAHAPHQNGMGIAQQAIGQGEPIQFGRRGIHGGNIIADLVPIVALLRLNLVLGQATTWGPGQVAIFVLVLAFMLFVFGPKSQEVQHNPSKPLLALFSLVLSAGLAGVGYLVFG